MHQGLHRSYEEWLIQQSQGSLPAPLLILDADQGIETMLQTYEKFTVSPAATEGLSSLPRRRSEAGSRTPRRRASAGCAPRA